LKKLIIFTKLSDTEKKDLSLIGFDQIFDFSNNNLNGENVTEFEINSFVKSKGFDIKWQNSVNSFAETKVNSKHIIDYLKFNDEKNDIWFYHKFRAFHLLKNKYYELKIVKELVETNDEEVDVFSNSLKDIYFNENKIKLIKCITKVKNKKYYFNYVKYLFVILIRILVSKKRISKNDPNNILHGYISNESKTRLLKNTEKKVIINNVWASLYEIYNQEFIVLEDFSFPKLNSKFTVDKRFFRTLGKYSFTFEYLLFKTFYNVKINKKIKIEASKLEINIKNINKNVKSDSVLLISEYLVNYGKSTKLYLRKFYAYLFFFKNNNFNSLVAYGETQTAGKIIIDAAKNSKITTFALQHGLIGKFNIAYNFSKFESTLNPIPDYTFIWGSHWKSVLLEVGNYPEKKLLVVGSLKTDIVPFLQDKKQEGEKQVSYFSQPQFDREERYNAIKYIIKSIVKFPELELLIKLHPSEKDDIFSKLINEYNCKNCRIAADQDLYSIFNSSTISITCFSTTGAESLVFNNILFIFDSKKNDFADYIKEDVAYLAQSEIDLHNLFESYVSGNLKQKENVQNYVESLFYKIDGKVSERVFNHIKELTENSNSNIT